MKRQDVMLIAVSAIAGALVALILATVLLGGHQKKLSVPVVESISSDFPDVQHDPQYKVIFNSSALDPTQTITIGSGQNGTPFSGNR